MVEGLRETKLPLVKFLADDVPVFDPAKPVAVEKFQVPASPQGSAETPLGN